MTRGWGPAVLVAAAAMVLAVAAACDGSPAAFRLADQPAEVVAGYAFASEQPQLLEQIACYCGCGDTLAHRNLRQCFYDDAGEPDAHGSGCGICLAEASVARERFEAGEDAASIAEAIDELFGGTAAPTLDRR